MRKLADMTGERHGRLTVIAKEPADVIKRTKWTCLCDCGNEISAYTSNLKTGRTASCGCKRIESTRQTGLDQKTHGLSKTPEYDSWCNMIARCYKDDHPAFDRYGGRGIVVWYAWVKSFPKFLKDMGYKPSPDHTLDRIDNDGNYRPDNCRWATRKVQSNNREVSLRFEHNGVMKTLGELSEEYGIARSTLNYRLVQRNQPIEVALAITPLFNLTGSRKCPTMQTSN